MEIIHHEIQTKRKLGGLKSRSDKGEMLDKWKKITGDKEGHYIILKGPICQEDIIILNLNASNNEALKYMTQKLTNTIREIDKTTIKFQEITNMQSIGYEKIEQLDINRLEQLYTNQPDLTDISITSPSCSRKCTVFFFF